MAHVAEAQARRGPRLRLGAERDELRPLLAERAGRLLVGTVAAVAVLTVVGLLALWPYGWESGAVSSRTVAAEVLRVVDAPCGTGTCAAW